MSEIVFCYCCSKKIERDWACQMILTPYNEASQINNFCKECYLQILLGIESLRANHIEQREQKSFTDRIKHDYR